MAFLVLTPKQVERFTWAANALTDGRIVKADVVQEATSVLLEAIAIGMKAPDYARAAGKTTKNPKTGKESVPGGIQKHYRHATYLYLARDVPAMVTYLKQGFSKTDADLGLFLREAKENMIASNIIAPGKSKMVQSIEERSLAWVPRSVKRLTAAQEKPVRTSQDAEPVTMPQNRPWQVAEDLRSGRRVLVTSVVMPEEESRAGGFVEQAAGLVELSTVHDRIAGILDYGRDNGRGFIVLEYPEGERLGNLLHREGPLDVRRSLCFGVQIAGVLEAVHLRGAAHGRLAVDDVLVVGDSVKVGGFERTLVEQYASEPRARRTASCNADESVAAAQRADTTALAVLLYFMMTDIYPSKGSRRLIPLRRMQRNVPVSVERVIMDVLGDRRGKVQSDLSDILNVLWLAAMKCERRSSQRGWGRLGTLPTATSVLVGTLGTIVTIVVIWSLARQPVTSSLPPGPSPHMVTAGASATPTLSGTSSWTLPPAPSALPKGSPAPRATRRNVVSQNVVSGESRTPALSAPARSLGAEAPASPVPAPPLRPEPRSTPSAIKQAVAAPEESHPDPTAIIDWLLREGATLQ